MKHFILLFVVAIGLTWFSNQIGQEAYNIIITLAVSFAIFGISARKEPDARK